MERMSPCTLTCTYMAHRGSSMMRLVSGGGRRRDSPGECECAVCSALIQGHHLFPSGRGVVTCAPLTVHTFLQASQQLEHLGSEGLSPRLRNCRGGMEGRGIRVSGAGPMIAFTSRGQAGRGGRQADRGCQGLRQRTTGMHP